MSVTLPHALGYKDSHTLTTNKSINKVLKGSVDTFCKYFNLKGSHSNQ